MYSDERLIVVSLSEPAILALFIMFAVIGSILSVCLVLGRRAVVRVRGVADSNGCDPSIPLPDAFQQLSRLMQFPEEVAFQLTDVEHRLFSCVSAVDYVRLVTSDLTKQPLVLPNTTATNATKARPTVSDLILRFQQVCIISGRIIAVVSMPPHSRFESSHNAKLCLALTVVL